ncbi:16S rRNA (guanine527-N7)-methyltransferase [Breznakia sp. PF5-3]|uniref:16S rRNA (guanine(527)-N(7))-methyltransferase RsmG n=1 Tax=unclassified Breznakia TaxID=2623764 RepID=UPI0024071A5E|nr:MULTISPECIES: 16S rRNA (guanine(527)-N(7))-methyltransferase RsmG [unclassified Breznakia]MDF9825681.1 16S rRNA (guanine527-N7)-methyltransferase [Breznakia sp. PM6-1]MDF9836508.1 16S rRNA (guanine527-N7)-methyltransferase [Breznakia sp. PF5-3]MDF9837811.1 16S rRNA (guanine527-N7)-methyltransferase [Breznakia sp. PFB2-8]MDF9859731.1 16S rRNA (guanine527-N7)-methyltransferase [Breznakia sp. PH5-24]
MGNKKNQFYENLKDHNQALSEYQKQQFEIYAAMLVEWNQKMNLTAIKEEDEIYEKHFLDCILMSYGVEIQGTFCDVGSGAGFPSLPLKIVYPDLKVWIVEPLQKRCQFLNALVDKLKLNDVMIINARAEDYVKEKREAFDIVSARAVANLAMLCELCIPLTKVNGLFIAMKGPNAKQEIDESNDAIKILGCELEGINFQDLNGNERNNLIIRKVLRTPKKYPRAFAQIKKHPLRSKGSNE